MQIEFWIIKLQAQKDEDRKSNQNLSTALKMNISPKYVIDLFFFFSCIAAKSHTVGWYVGAEAQWFAQLCGLQWENGGRDLKGSECAVV